MLRSRPGAALVAALVVVQILASAHASMMAIDLASEFLKVSLIKPGRTPISIVVNEMSKRKTPALVGFSSLGERLLGEEASSFAVRYPETTYARAMELLGKSAGDPTIAHMLKDHRWGDSTQHASVRHQVSRQPPCSPAQQLLRVYIGLGAATCRGAHQSVCTHVHVPPTFHTTHLHACTCSHAVQPLHAAHSLQPAPNPAACTRQICSVYSLAACPTRL